MKRIVSVIIDRGDLAEAGGCWVRISPGRIYATYHPNSPIGVSVCGICDRIVLRAMGRWWDVPNPFGYGPAGHAEPRTAAGDPAHTPGETT